MSGRPQGEYIQMSKRFDVVGRENCTRVGIFPWLRKGKYLRLRESMHGCGEKILACQEEYTWGVRKRIALDLTDSSTDNRLTWV